MPHGSGRGLPRLSAGRPIPHYRRTTSPQGAFRKTHVKNPPHATQKNWRGTRECAIVFHRDEARRAGPPTRPSRRRPGNKHSFPQRAAVALLRLETRSPAAAGQRLGSRPATSPVAGTRDTASSPSYAIMRVDGRRAVPRPGARRRALAFRCDASIEATLFAAKGLPRSLRCPSAASAFEIARKLSPRCPLGSGEILRPLDDLRARLGVALATVDLDAGRAFAPARSRQLTSNVVFSLCDTPR